MYEFVDDNSCDPGIIYISAGHKTLKQKILKGDKTIEGHKSGNGVLTVSNQEKTVKYNFPGEKLEAALHKGDVMQWSAETDMVVYEICYPPYTSDRFHNLD